VRELDLVTEYTGHPYDPVLGVYYARARMYDAADRRFMAVDLVRGNLAATQSLNRYVYVVNNPITLIDFTGLEPELVGGAKISVGSNKISNVYVDIVNAKAVYYVDYKEALKAFGVDKALKSAKFVEVAKLLILTVQNQFANPFGDPPAVYAFSYYSIDNLTLIDFEYFQKLMCEAGWNYEWTSDKPGNVGRLKVVELPASVEKGAFVTKDQIHRIGYYIRQKMSARNRWELLPDEDVVEMNRILVKYRIDDIDQIRHFLAQVFKETATGLLENGDFRDRDLKSSNSVANWDDPRASAHAGDGNLYRGAGYLQLTLKTNYYRFASQMKAESIGDGQKVFDEIINGGTSIISDKYPWESAGWVWINDVTGGWGSPQNNYLNGKANKKTTDAIVSDITRSIKGSSSSASERKKYYDIISMVI